MKTRLENKYAVIAQQLVSCVSFCESSIALAVQRIKYVAAHVIYANIKTGAKVLQNETTDITRSKGCFLV